MAAGSRAAVASALGVEFALPQAATGGRDLVVHASATAAGLQRSLDLLAPEATVVELSWYGDRPVELSLGGAFHAGRLTVRSSQVGMVSPARASRRGFADRLALALELLADPVFADYLEAYGRGGQRAMQHDALKYLGRLYWYTVEFGLVAEPDGLRIYGSGIASSYAESQFALDDPSPNRLAFDMKRVMQTEYRIDDFQQNYFVIPSFDELLRVTVETDFAPLYDQLKAEADVPVAAILPDDKVITRGTQEYVTARAS